jgi:hypothetical protein
MMIGAFVFRVFTTGQSPKQGLRITNTGSQSIDVRKLARWSWQEEEWTLHPGATFLWMFAPGEHFQFARSDQPPPKPGTTPPPSPRASFSRPRSELWPTPVHQNPDGSTTILLRHVDRTAEVRVNEAGQVEFKFTDL